VCFFISELFFVSIGLNPLDLLWRLKDSQLFSSQKDLICFMSLIIKLSD